MLRVLSVIISCWVPSVMFFFVQQKNCWSEDLGGCSVVGSIVGSPGLQCSAAWALQKPLGGLVCSAQRPNGALVWLLQDQRSTTIAASHTTRLQPQSVGRGPPEKSSTVESTRSPYIPHINWRVRVEIVDSRFQEPIKKVDGWCLGNVKAWVRSGLQGLSEVALEALILSRPPIVRSTPAME